jgi:hypothetical protein
MRQAASRVLRIMLGIIHHGQNPSECVVIPCWAYPLTLTREATRSVCRMTWHDAPQSVRRRLPAARQKRRSRHEYERGAVSLAIVGQTRVYP